MRLRLQGAPLPVLLLTLILSAACGTVGIEEPVIHDPAGLTSARLAVADSLMLRGSFDACRDSLLRLLADGAPQAEVMLRLAGLYGGRAMEPRLLLLLDSLESSGQEGLDGWRLSVLSLGDRTEEALAAAGPDRPLLQALLLEKLGRLPVEFYTPCPDTPGEVHAWASVVPPERMDRSDLEALAPFAGTFPTVSSALLEGMAALSDTAGAWWWEFADSLSSSGLAEVAATAVCTRFAREDGGDPAYWLGLLEAGGELAPVAAAEIASRFPETLDPDWDTEDLLVRSGSPQLVLAFSAGGDGFHRVGAEMAVLLAQGRYPELSRLCAGVGAGDPDSLRARAALFSDLGLQASGAPSSSLAPMWVAFAREFPWHPDARKLAYDAGKYYDCEQMWDEAAEAYLVSLRSSGSYDGDEQGTWRCGFSLYMSGDLSRADSVLAAGASRWPCGYWRDEALFWRARVAGERGDQALADSLTVLVAEEHPWEYYGMLASRSTGSPTLPRLAVPEILPASCPACSGAVALLADGYAAAALELLQSGPAVTAPRRAATLSLIGMHGMALTMLRQIDQSMRDSSIGSLPDSLLCYYFPAPFLDLAGSATARLGLTAPMLLGIMREESYFDRRAVSPAGAMGLVQLMPGTASDVARWYNLPPLTGEDFFDPVASVPYGALYIDRQRSAYEGAEALFLAAYNAGPGNADRWVGMHGWNPSDPSLYIEQITYRETRSYVKKVLLSSWIYEGYMR
jgi:soluble lytic murein transglycosylase-like protein